MQASAPFFLIASSVGIKKNVRIISAYAQVERKRDTMMKFDKITVHYEEVPIYDINIKLDFSSFYKDLEKLDTKDRKICIVCDSITKDLYLNEVIHQVKEYCHQVESFTFPAGEQSKNLDTVRKLYEQLILSRFDRSDLLIALGGGVVGDLCGFTAATYLRGIGFLQMPTTLLSMVDSSIGGKTGVDFDSYKNMVGAFHQPKSVYISTKSLSTLDKRVYVSGFGEVIKYGLISDREFYDWLKVNREQLLAYEENVLSEMIYRSCVNKQKVVEADPEEKGIRAVLNLGHTIGHAVEKMKNFELYHGECVSIGMVAAAYISYKRGTLTEEELQDLKETLRSFGLPITVDSIIPREVLEATKNDKKMQSGKIKFILMKGLGETYIDNTISEEELLEAINYVLEA